MPFASERALDAVEAQCRACREHEPPFDAARSFGLYTGKLRKAILRVKFSGDERLGRHLGGLLVSTWDSVPGLRDAAAPLLVPVPLHSLRQRERGFNQSELVASGLLKALVPRKAGTAAPRVMKSSLRRVRATPPQTGLSVSARHENLRGAFEVAKTGEMKDRVVVLIDDVMTTGATIRACARVCQRAGAAKVFALTVARATPQFPDLSPAEDDNTVDGFGAKST